MMPDQVQTVAVVDSHTGGEPTRVLIDGLELSGGTMSEKREQFAREYGWLRTAVICEPRGHEAIVGALLTEPVNPGSVAGVIFFNNVGCLNGCIHGTIGVAVTLYYLGRIERGVHSLDTPTGVVTIEVGEKGIVKVRNVRSYRTQKGVAVELKSGSEITGDVAWGGNWFFLTNLPDHLDINYESIRELTDYACAIRESLEEAGITGDDDGEIDHIELFGPPSDPALGDSQNFVLCPGREYDRSPCGTGTCARMATLYARGQLELHCPFRHEGILGTVFEGELLDMRLFLATLLVIGGIGLVIYQNRTR